MCSGEGPPWEFEKDGQALRVRVNGQVTFNNTYAMIDAAVTGVGIGIAYVPENIVTSRIASGALDLDDVWRSTTGSARRPIGEPGSLPFRSPPSLRGWRAFCVPYGCSVAVSYSRPAQRPQFCFEIVAFQ